MNKFCYLSGFDRNSLHVLPKQAKALQYAGYEVTIIVSDNKSDDIIDGIRVVGSGAKRSLYTDRLFRVPNLLYKKALEIDADGYQTCDLGNVWACIRLKRKGKRIFFDFLEGHPYTLEEKIRAPRIVIKTIIKLLEKYLGLVLKRFDAVFAVTGEILDYLNKWGVKKTHLLTNYPEVNENYSLSYEDYCNRTPAVLYFGAIYGISRQEVVFDALAQCPNVHYILAGIFGDAEICQYQLDLQQHPYWKEVEFINGFPRSELPSIIARATIGNVLRDFSQMPGTRNGSLGVIKIFETMEAGLPILCSDVPVYREIFKKYNCGILVDPNDASQIRNAVKYLTENKEDAYKMGQEGRRAVIEEFNWNNQKKQYLSVLDNAFLTK